MREFLNWFENAKPDEGFVIKGKKATTTVEIRYESDPKIYCSICGSEFSEHKSEGLLISSETFKIKKYDSKSESWKEEAFFVCPNCKNSIRSFFKRRW